jgi:hypothetical protein
MLTARSLFRLVFAPMPVVAPPAVSNRSCSCSEMVTARRLPVGAGDAGADGSADRGGNVEGGGEGEIGGDGDAAGSSALGVRSILRTRTDAALFLVIVVGVVDTGGGSSGERDMAGKDSWCPAHLVNYGWRSSSTARRRG